MLGIRKGLAVAMALFVMGAAGNREAAVAAALDLTLQSGPQLMSDFIDVNYDAAAHTFTARGFAEEIKSAGGESTAIDNGAFEITASIAPSGELTAGTLTVTGEIPSLGIDQGVLLTGKVRELGYGEKGEPLEMKFDASGGSLEYHFGPVVKVILSQSGFPGAFSADFSSTSIAVAGTGW